MQTATPETRSKPEIRSSMLARSLFLAVMEPTTVVSKAKSVARTSYVLVKRAVYRVSFVVIRSGTTVQHYVPVSFSIHLSGTMRNHVNTVRLIDL